jgi:endonuclease/exonuclease/phosphatase family metal-dependent hydrolase
LVRIADGQPPRRAPAPGPHTLRVLTWNVRDLLGEHRRVYRAIAATRADVLCLQEGPRLLGSRFLLAQLARETGMYVVDGGRVSAGLAILVSLRADVRRFHAELLPKAPQSWSTDPAKLLPRPRGVVRAEVGLPGAEAIRIASVHLPLLASERAKHVPSLRDWPDGRRAQVIAGDLNEVSGQPTWESLSEFARDPGGPDAHWTFPTFDLQRRIDVILVDPALAVTRYGWPVGVSLEDCARGSDHLPVFADIELPPRV